MEREATEKKAGLRLLAVGSMGGAIAASSCCVLPLLFAAVGVSGAWIGALTKLAPYQPIFLIAAVTSIGTGFWTVHRDRQAVCEGPQCHKPTARRATKAALWLATAIVAVVVTADWWARLLA